MVIESRDQVGMQGCWKEVRSERVSGKEEQGEGQIDLHVYGRLEPQFELLRLLQLCSGLGRLVHWLSCPWAQHYLTRSNWNEVCSCTVSRTS